MLSIFLKFDYILQNCVNVTIITVAILVKEWKNPILR